MTGAQLYALRKRAGLGRVAFAFALGYRGTPLTMRTKMRRYEMWGAGTPLPAAVALRAAAFEFDLDAKKLRDRRAMLTPSRG